MHRDISFTIKCRKKMWLIHKKNIIATNYEESLVFIKITSCDIIDIPLQQNVFFFFFQLYVLLRQSLTYDTESRSLGTRRSDEVGWLALTFSALDEIRHQTKIKFVIFDVNLRLQFEFLQE